MSRHSKISLASYFVVVFCQHGFAETVNGPGTSSLTFSADKPGFVLLGNSIGVGINSYGTLGDSSTYGRGILFDKDASGTFDTTNDFLAPGSPFEGFYLSDGSTRFWGANNAGFEHSGIIGTLTDYSGVSYNGETYDRRVVWVGTSGDATVTHDYFFNDDDLRVQIKTTVENSSATNAISDLYFSRTIDPDAVVSAGDSSVTRNTLAESGSAVAVYGETLESLYLLGLLAEKGQANVDGVTAIIPDSWLLPTDPQATFNAASLESPNTADSVIALSFSLGTLPAESSVSFLYSYIFGNDILSFVGGSSISVPDLKQDLVTHAAHLRRSGVVGTMAALQFPGQQTSGAQVSTQGTATGGLKVWSDIEGGQLKGAVTGTTRSLNLGAMSELENGAVIGAIVKRGNFALESSASSLEGSSLRIQPYLSTRMGQTDVTIGFGLGRTDYDEYTLGATTGTANSRTSEAFAKVGYRFEIDSDASMTAYGSVLAGREAMEFDGGLAAASDETVTYSYSAVGLNYQRALSAATMLTSSLEVGRYRDNGVGTSTTIDTAASDGANIAIGLGLEGYTNGGMQWAINANASNQGGSWVGSGVTAGLKISF